MDASHYARAREIFLEVEEYPPEQWESEVRRRAAGDEPLVDEVLSLLTEHDADAARIEGEQARRQFDTAKANFGGIADLPVAPGAGEGDRPLSPPFGSAPETLKGAQRTHVSPRYGSSEKPAPSVQKSLHNNRETARRRRLRKKNSGWLWLAAVLPTALVGWLTFRQVEAISQDALRNELSEIANSLALATDRFLENKARLVQSWSRQPEIRQAVLELLEIAGEEDATESLRRATQTDVIFEQLQELSGREDIKFVIWDASGKTIASWLEDRADVGNMISRADVLYHWSVMRGNSVLYGPERLIDTTEGFVPETERPVMAQIVPIHGSEGRGEGRVVAVMLVRGLNLYDEFNQIFVDAAESSEIDAYVVDTDGMMLTESPHAMRLAAASVLEISPEQLAVNLRVTDPGRTLTAGDPLNVDRLTLPLTVAASEVAGGKAGALLEPYNNYAGEDVVGAWRWLPQWQKGIIVERSAGEAFAAARIVRVGFISLGLLLSLTALGSAWQMTRRVVDSVAGDDPLSRYEMIEELGSGGMGTVYRARHYRLGREAAVKVLRGDRQYEDDRSRFDREARLAASLTNAHSVTIYDYGATPHGELFCVMELLDGLTLQDVVARSGHQPIGRALHIIRQICVAMVEAHSMDLMHRDLKPQNVMLSFDVAAGDWAVVFDFGLAKPLQPKRDLFHTSETVWAGTPMYMAPERFRDPSNLDPRSDIYAIGGIAYFLLSGRPPFAECDPESMFGLILSEEPISIETHRGEAVPAEVQHFVRRCMSKNVSERFASVQDLADELDRLRESHVWTIDEAARWWHTHAPEQNRGRNRPEATDNLS